MKIPSKKLILVVFALVLIIGVAVGVFFSRPSSSKTLPLENPNTTPTGMEAPQVTLVDSVLQQLASKLGVEAKLVETTILQNNGEFLFGSYKSGNLVGNFYVVCKELDCRLIHAGPELPSCALLNAEKVSGGLAPDCLNSSGEVESRLFAE